MRAAHARDRARQAPSTPKHAGLDNAVAVGSQSARSAATTAASGCGRPPRDGADITTLVAATRALRNWDQWFANKKPAGNKPHMGE